MDFPVPVLPCTSFSAGALVTRPARSPQRSGRGKPRAQRGRLPGPIPLLSPSVAKASRHPFLGQAPGPAGAGRGEAAALRPQEQARPGRGQRLPAVTSGRLADPWPAVTDALFTGGVQTGNPGRFPDSVAAGRWEPCAAVRRASRLRSWERRSGRCRSRSPAVVSGGDRVSIPREHC